MLILESVHLVDFYRFNPHLFIKHMEKGYVYEVARETDSKLYAGKR